jgi:cbb3-type cytochrome oxidase maturation protein
MEVLPIVVPLAILLALGFIAGFIWMTMRGQYDDLETPAMRMLLDEKTLENLNAEDKLDPKKDMISNKERK